MKLWSTVLGKAVEVETRLQRSSALMAAGPISIPFLSGGQTERDQRERGAIFETIISFIKLMQELQVGSEETEALVMTYCKSCNLSPNQVDTISVQTRAHSY